MDEEGYVKFLGRKRELIKCSGYSVFPAEVEALLYRHPAVKETAVIGVTDPYRGETPKAFIILKPEYAGKISEKEILDWCKENMAAYKRPRLVEFREELPKSAAGKLSKWTRNGPPMGKIKKRAMGFHGPFFVRLIDHSRGRLCTLIGLKVKRRIGDEKAQNHRQIDFFSRGKPLR